jgi:hypothetical protein
MVGAVATGGGVAVATCSSSLASSHSPAQRTQKSTVAPLTSKAGIHTWQTGQTAPTAPPHFSQAAPWRVCGCWHQGHTGWGQARAAPRSQSVSPFLSVIWSISLASNHNPWHVSQASSVTPCFSISLSST